jgi:hypothetical protein
VANGPVPATTGGGRRTVVSGGHGLTGLQERARLVGGMVHAGSTVGGGFRVAGVLPYGPQSPHASRGGRRRVDPGWEASTFVDAANDFRGQSEGAVPGDGGADIDWSGPPDRQKEFDIAMGSKKKGIAIGCGTALLVLVIVLVGLFVVPVFYLAGKEVDKVMIDPSVYNSVKVGDAETAVRDKLPRGRSFLAEGMVEEGPAVPAGAACSSYLSTDDERAKGGKAPAYRFCFKGGKLIEKAAYMVES